MIPPPDRAWFAAFLDVRGCAALVVGGGEIGARKAEALLRAGARVTIVAPELCSRLAEWARGGGVEHRARRYEAADLAGMRMVVAATDDAGINAAIAREARDRGIPVNVADAPALSTFITPAVIDRLPIQIAVVSGGASPVLTRRVREAIEQAVPGSCGALAAVAARFRGASLQRFPDPARRRDFWNRMLDGPLARALDEGGEAKAEALLRRELGAGPDAGALPRDDDGER